MGPQGDEVHNAGNGNVMSTVVDQMVPFQSPLFQEVCQEEHQEVTGDGPENSPQYTTVFVGNLAHEVTQAELHRQFHLLGAGIIEDVRVQRDKGFGFVRYRSHEEAAFAIQAANGRVICGKSVKCSWGSKPTSPGTLSLPLPPPPQMGPFQGVLPAGINQGYSAADLLAYQRQILTQASTGRALLPLPHQQGMGLGMGQALMGTQGSHGVYDGFQPGAGLAGGHERMYY